MSSTGISTRMAYCSNYGTEQTNAAAPGGDFYDSADNTGDPRNEVLAAYPKNLAELNGDLNPDGTPNSSSVVRDCNGSICGYYQYLRGTSMAAPHAVGVAALIVSEFGKTDRRLGGHTAARGDCQTTGRFRSRARLPRAAAVPLHTDPFKSTLRRRVGRALCRAQGGQRLLRCRHRQRLRSGDESTLEPDSRRAPDLPIADRGPSSYTSSQGRRRLPTPVQ